MLIIKKPYIKNQEVVYINQKYTLGLQDRPVSKDTCRTSLQPKSILGTYTYIHHAQILLISETYYVHAYM